MAKRIMSKKKTLFFLKESVSSNNVFTRQLDLDKKIKTSKKFYFYKKNRGAKKTLSSKLLLFYSAKQIK